jgi:1-aminocyclopropane-1-carboxylate deaminase
MDIARFDLLHPVVSGNKFFKLKYQIEEALQRGKKGVITMGGAYSNHLIATACYCEANGLQSKGLVRGGLPEPLNHTLAQCRQMGMELIPVARASFHEEHHEIQELLAAYDEYYFIPSGGRHADGIKGAGEMTDRIHGFEQYDIITCSMGSGTMFMGLQSALHPHQTIIGIPALRIKPEAQESFIRNHAVSGSKTRMYFEYAGKGFGKADENLFSFMNQLYQRHGIPTDFVYTGKLCYAIMDLMAKGEIDRDQKVLIIHSGGLQGNQSLPADTLIF